MTRLPQVAKAAIQTNLSRSIEWARDCEASRLGVWATYHPEWADRARFVEKVLEIHDLGASVSAGVVGFKKFTSEIRALRRELPEDVYVWINAPKRFESFAESEIRAFEEIDPFFRYNTIRHPSLGRACQTGREVVSVDGDGTVRRCHFVPDPIGNLYDPGFESSLVARPCPNETCDCHIGYVHLEHLGLDRVFGDGILERVPEAPRPGMAEMPALPLPLGSQ